ncbi:hypothetical protein [Cryobacterium sp. PH31-L1]|uniref:hypothetical protein n=1 Tax=Cryobacterium sp. PH31-L1 TaxID=3046199 RepID=UPI0024B96AA3|nr:hypothetical protein [Cryobacterium sp. PH31-L1]MDJ0378183.1 hypothetical protein [Cryobacterium sp. PH31-L1]
MGYSLCIVHIAGGDGCQYDAHPHGGIELPEVEAGQELDAVESRILATTRYRAAAPG